MTLRRYDTLNHGQTPAGRKGFNHPRPRGPGVAPDRTFVAARAAVRGKFRDNAVSWLPIL
jgi:hypothetical protein